MITATVRLDFRRLQRFQRAAGDGTNNPRIQRTLKQWAARYRGFARARFARLSKSNGDGIWPPLAASTILRRRQPSRARKNSKRSTSRLVSILWDTGLLIGALDPMSETAPGALVAYKPFSVIVGYGGSESHGKGKATIADIANFHQTGAGNLPKREIIVPPDAHTMKMMASDMNKALLQVAKDSGF